GRHVSSSARGKWHDHGNRARWIDLHLRRCTLNVSQCCSKYDGEKQISHVAPHTTTTLNASAARTCRLRAQVAPVEPISIEFQNAGGCCFSAQGHVCLQCAV